MEIMEKLALFAIGGILLLIGFVLGGGFESTRTINHFGYTVDQGKLFKEQCEANLPRNVHCSTVVLYVPDNESEQ